MKIVKVGDPIYKRDSTGKVRVWSYDIGTNGSDWGWRTNAGIKGGKIVTSEWTIVEQKNVGRANETSLEQQANLEGDADRKKKLDRGYFERVDDVDSFTKIKPMLASKHEAHKYDFESNEYYSQPKLDGIRCIARRDGLWTRTGKEIVAVPHIADELSVLFAKYPDAVLDGELYNHELKDDFNKIVSMVRKAKPTDEDIAESKRLVQYHVYDVVNVPEAERNALAMGADPFFIDRRGWFYGQGFGDGAVKAVQTRAVANQEELDNLYGDYLEDGYEGQMIRLNAVYQENKRSKYLIKRKEFLDKEFDVIRIEEGIGNWAGYIKRFVLELGDGREFSANVRGTQEVLKKLLESGETPTWATVRYFTPTPDGFPRFPVVTDWGFGKRED